MGRFFVSITRQFVFWLLFFALNRAVFLIFYHHLIALEGPPFGEILSGFWHALRLDISTASYILIIPFILLAFKLFSRRRFPDVLNRIYTLVIILAYGLICAGELGTYGEWKTKLHYKALHYLSNPDEVYNSASTGQFILLVVLFILLSGISWFLYTRYFYRPLRRVRKNIPAKAVFLLLIPGLLFLGLRGGIQPIPITHSQSFYSRYNILNLAAVNTGYSFTFSMIENYRFMKDPPYRFFDEELARQTVDRLNSVEKDTTLSILKVKRPNIVILLLESWSADLIHSLGGEAGITPEFEELAKEGILFTRLYASGNRSEQAMSSLFAGFPATPITAITHNLDKVVSLPSLPERLKSEGYYTSFYFGGHLMYGGIKSYLSIAGFDRMLEIYDFPDSMPRGKLGIHDEFIFDYQLEDLGQTSEPFFSVIFSLSTHSPYDQPMEKVLDWGGSENEYINSAYYTDRCLGDYFRKAKEKAWYDSTLFIIVADHSHNSYRHWHVTSPQYRHIPMLLYGNVIDDSLRGIQVGRLSSQTDLPVTLLKQLGLGTDEFYWSRDLFNPYTPEFAFYEATNGLGWIRPDGHFVWHKNYGYLEKESSPEKEQQMLLEGKAYLQELFRQFMDY